MNRKIVEIPKNYVVSTEEDFDRTQAEVLASQMERFSTCGVIKNAIQPDIWTTNEEEDPEILVDCE